MQTKILLSLLLFLCCEEALGGFSRLNEPWNWLPKRKIEGTQTRAQRSHTGKRSTYGSIGYQKNPRQNYAVLRKTINRETNPTNHGLAPNPQHINPTKRNRRQSESNNGYNRINVPPFNERRRPLKRGRSAANAIPFQNRNANIKKRAENQKQTRRRATAPKKRRVNPRPIARNNRKRRMVDTMEDTPRNMQRAYQQNTPESIEEGRKTQRVGRNRQRRFNKNEKSGLLKNSGSQRNDYFLDTPTHNDNMAFQNDISEANPWLNKRSHQNNRESNHGSYKLSDTIVEGPRRLHENQKRNEGETYQKQPADIANNNGRKLHSTRSNQLEAAKQPIRKRKTSNVLKKKLLHALPNDVQDLGEASKEENNYINENSDKKRFKKTSTNLDMTNEQIRDLENEAGTILKKIEQLREQIDEEKDMERDLREDGVDDEFQQDVERKENENVQEERSLVNQAKPGVQKSWQKEKILKFNQPVTKRETKEGHGYSLQETQEIRNEEKDGFEKSTERKKKRAKDMYKKFLSDNNKIIETKINEENIEDKEDFSDKAEAEQANKERSLKEPRDIQEKELEEYLESVQERVLDETENPEIDFIIGERVEIVEPNEYNSFFDMMGWAEPKELDASQMEAESIETSYLDADKIDMYIEILKNIELEDEEIERFLEDLKTMEVDDQSIEKWGEALKKKQVGYKNLEEDFKIVKNEFNNDNLESNAENDKDSESEKTVEEENEIHKEEISKEQEPTEQENNERSRISWIQSVNTETKTDEQEIDEESRGESEQQDDNVKIQEDTKNEVDEKRKEEKEIKRKRVQDRKLHRQLVNKKNRIKQYEGERLVNNTSTPPCSYEQRRGVKNLCGCKFPDTCVRVYECTAHHCSFKHKCMTPAETRHICRPNTCKEDETCYLVAKQTNETSAGCLLVDKNVVKPGKCPMLRNPYGSSGSHNESTSCLTDSDCSDDRKCCQLKDLSKRTCTDPVAEIPKPGMCPPKEFLSLLSAQQPCQKDVDCPQCLKCCKGETESHCYRPLSKYEAEKWHALY